MFLRRGQIRARCLRVEPAGQPTPRRHHERVALLLTLAALTAAVLTNASARTDAKRAVCHRTASETKPYVKLRVSAKQLAAHAKHAADIIPAPAGGCPTTSSRRPRAAGRSVALTGEVESPDGDPVATAPGPRCASAPGRDRSARQLDATNLPPAAAARLLGSSTGSSGDRCRATQAPNASGKSSGCRESGRSGRSSMTILRRRGSRTASTCTRPSSRGAIRGQLTGTSTDSLGRVSLDLKGTSEPNAKGQRRCASARTRASSATGRMRRA